MKTWLIVVSVLIAAPAVGAAIDTLLRRNHRVAVYDRLLATFLQLDNERWRTLPQWAGLRIMAVGRTVLGRSWIRRLSIALGGSLLVTTVAIYMAGCLVWELTQPRRVRNYVECIDGPITHELKTLTQTGAGPLLDSEMLFRVRLNTAWVFSINMICDLATAAITVIALRLIIATRRSWVAALLVGANFLVASFLADLCASALTDGHDIMFYGQRLFYRPFWVVQFWLQPLEQLGDLPRALYASTTFLPTALVLFVIICALAAKLALTISQYVLGAALEEPLTTEQIATKFRPFTLAGATLGILGTISKALHELVSWLW